LRRKAFRCSMQGDLTQRLQALVQGYSRLIPFAPKGYGWLDGVYFTCRLYFDTMGVRSPSKPNLRSISRANTLRERDGRIARERDSSPFPSLLLTSIVILLWHKVPAALLYVISTQERSQTFGCALWTSSNFPQGVIWPIRKCITFIFKEVTNLTYLFIYLLDRRILIVYKKINSVFSIVDMKDHKLMIFLTIF